LKFVRLGPFATVTGWKYGFPAFGSNEKRQRVESPTFQASE
jgi:hypothetical protein